MNRGSSPYSHHEKDGRRHYHLLASRCSGSGRQSQRRSELISKFCFHEILTTELSTFPEDTHLPHDLEKHSSTANELCILFSIVRMMSLRCRRLVLSASNLSQANKILTRSSSTFQFSNQVIAPAAV